MKFRLTLFLVFLALKGWSQNEVSIYTERQGSDVVVYADNPAVIPMTAEIKLNLTNMKTDFGGDEGLFVIPQKAERHQLLSAKATRRIGKIGLGLESIIYIGDVLNQTASDHIYELPFASGMTYQISQGYNGRFSHKGVNAIDFAMDVGEKVYAARAGIVYRVVEKNSKSCQHSSCQEYNNYIMVYHDDGTFSEYSHLKYNGANVNVGDRVEAGDFIGYSGNTGWSSGPHLHFVVYKYDQKGNRQSLKTKFRTRTQGDVLLKENENYSKE